MTRAYTYEPWVYEALQRTIRGALAVGQTLRRVTLDDDFGGIDAQYVVNQACPLAVRARFNRPAYAADWDITLRGTEPRMIRAGTYAPLGFFAWFQGHHVVAAKVIDIYRMDKLLTPPLDARPTTANGDGTAFLSVSISELHSARALLRTYDGNTWNTPSLGGELQLQRIIAKARRCRHCDADRLLERTARGWFCNVCGREF